MRTDDDLMEAALVEARRALEHNDVPIGALVVVDHDIISSRHNEREQQQDPTAHAEILALRDASQHFGRWRLDGATVVTTIEPCPMCAGALVSSRIRRLVVGASDLKGGAVGSLYNLASDPRLHHEIEITSGVLAEKCGALVSDYFSNRRS